MYLFNSLTVSIAATTLAWNHSGKAWNTTTCDEGPTAINTGSLLKSTSAPPPQIVEILVGASGRLAFNPESLSVMPGTLLRFNFLGFNHTLTQSSEEHPCLNESRFDTGFNQFNPGNVSGKFLIEYTVQNTKPMWFYCAQTAPKSHCEAGMVFVLNPRKLSSTSVSTSLPSANATSRFRAPHVAPTNVTFPNTTLPRQNHTQPVMSNTGSSWKYGFPNLLGLLVLSFLCLWGDSLFM